MRTVPNCTNLTKKLVVFIKSTQMVLDLTLKCLVTKNYRRGMESGPKEAGWHCGFPPQPV